MKKTLLLLALFLTVFYGFAQETKTGVRIGYNISNLSFDEEVPAGIENRHRNGFAIGFFGEYSLSKCIAIAPELQFSAEGAQEEALRIDYIQLPVIFKYKVNDLLSIGLGPQAGLKTHSFDDSLRNIAFSGVAGFEYMISDYLFFDARYAYGLTNIFDDEVKLDAQNTNIQIGLGVKF